MLCCSSSFLSFLLPVLSAGFAFCLASAVVYILSLRMEFGVLLAAFHVKTRLSNQCFLRTCERGCFVLFLFPFFECFVCFDSGSPSSRVRESVLPFLSVVLACLAFPCLLASPPDRPSVSISFHPPGDDSGECGYFCLQGRAPVFCEEPYAFLLPYFGAFFQKRKRK